MTAAVPLHVITALGFGPLGYMVATDEASAQRRLDQISSSSNGFYTALETCGSTGQRVVVLLVELGGSANAEQLAHHTTGADSDVIARTIDRLERAGIVVRGIKGGLRLSDDGLRLLQRRSVSYADPQAITSDVLAVICRQLGFTTPHRKQERIDAPPPSTGPACRALCCDQITHATVTGLGACRTGGGREDRPCAHSALRNRRRRRLRTAAALPPPPRIR